MFKPGLEYDITQALNDLFLQKRPSQNITITKQDGDSFQCGFKTWVEIIIDVLIPIQMLNGSF